MIGSMLSSKLTMKQFKLSNGILSLTIKNFNALTKDLISNMRLFGSLNLWTTFTLKKLRMASTDFFNINLEKMELRIHLTSSITIQNNSLISYSQETMQLRIDMTLSTTRQLWRFSLRVLQNRLLDMKLMINRMSVIILKWWMFIWFLFCLEMKSYSLTKLKKITWSTLTFQNLEKVHF